MKDTDLVSHETLDGSSLPSGLGVSTVDSFVHKEDGKPPSLIVGLTHLDRKKEVVDGGSVEVSLSAGIKHSCWFWLKQSVETLRKQQNVEESKVIFFIKLQSTYLYS